MVLPAETARPFAAEKAAPANPITIVAKIEDLDGLLDCGQKATLCVSSDAGPVVTYEDGSKCAIETTDKPDEIKLVRTNSSSQTTQMVSIDPQLFDLWLARKIAAVPLPNGMNLKMDVGRYSVTNTGGSFSKINPQESSH